MPTNVAIYARTSFDCPASAEDQIHHLETVAADRGWAVSRVFADRATTIKKGRENRLAEAALMHAIRAGEVTRALIWSIDRVGRSLADLVGFLEICRAAGVSLWLDHEKLDTETGNGLSLFDVSEVLAHHQRQTRRDRILRGQAAARRMNVRFGRPALPDAKVEKAKMLLVAGNGVHQTARMAAISPAAVCRLRAGLETTAASN